LTFAPWFGIVVEDAEGFLGGVDLVDEEGSVLPFEVLTEEVLFEFDFDELVGTEVGEEDESGLTGYRGLVVVKFADVEVFDGAISATSGDEEVCAVGGLIYDDGLD
jgi:hypothetical protein